MVYYDNISGATCIYYFFILSSSSSVFAIGDGSHGFNTSDSSTSETSIPTPELIKDPF